MLNFFLKPALLAIAVATTCVAIYHFRPIEINHNDYLAIIKQKHTRLERLSSPRVILTGGSNVAFGIDSKKIEAELNRPVVNMGIHAGLGLTLMLNELKPAIRKGDIIILSPEYYIREADFELWLHTIDHYPEAANYQPTSRFTMKTEQFKRYIFQIQKTVTGQFDPDDASSLYQRSSFDNRGDFVAHISLHELPVLKKPDIIRKEDYSDYIKKMNNFKAFTDLKGAQVYFMYPSYAPAGFHKNMNAIRHYEKQIKEQLKIKVLNQPETFSYPDNYFFDTAYHLNALGRAKRTEFIIDSLKEEGSVKAN